MMNGANGTSDIEGKAARGSSEGRPESTEFQSSQREVEIDGQAGEPNAKDMKFDDVVEEAKEATVLVLVY